MKQFYKIMLIAFPLMIDAQVSVPSSGGTGIHRALSGIPGRRPVAKPPVSIPGKKKETRKVGSGETYAEKRKQVVDLVERGAQFLQDNEFDQVCHAFTRTKQFVKGELYLFLFDMNGFCYAHGNNTEFIWQNILNLQDNFGTFIIQDMIAKAEEGGGWITYDWRNSTKISYVKKVNKDQKTYVIGCGYYPHSAADTVVNLVKGAVALFNKELAAGQPVLEAFSTMSYPIGSFVFGNLYLYAADFNGVLFAQGNRPELIGSNVIGYQDERGFYLNKEIIKRLKESSGGIWVDYISTNAPKRTYAEKVKDKKGKEYFIAAGYYPDADRNATITLVRKGYKFLKEHGLIAAQEEFTSKRSNEFRYGDLYLFVYDMKGKCWAHGGNESYVGKNQLDEKDQDGRFYVREFIEKAKSGGGWVNAKLNNAFETSYVELVDLGTDQYVIGSSLYPISKEDSLTLIVNSAADYLQSHKREDAFAQFMLVKGGTFVRGDLDIFVIGLNGLCYVYDSDTNLIWRNISSLKDDQGKPFVRDIIRSSGQGSGASRYRLNGAEKIVYTRRVHKDGKVYVLGSGYYE